MQKINSLEQGISVAEVGQLPLQDFGTMGNDILTGLTSEAFDENSVQQLYAFKGDDLLIAEGNSLWHLYGGSGQDIFKIYETYFFILNSYHKKFQKFYERKARNSQFLRQGYRGRGKR